MTKRINRTGDGISLYLNREMRRGISLVNVKRREEGKPPLSERQFIQVALVEKLRNELDVNVRLGVREERADKKYYLASEEEVEVDTDS